MFGGIYFGQTYFAQGYPSGQVTTTKTLNGTLRVQNTTNKTLNGITRIQKTTSQSLTGQVRIQKTSSQSLTGTTRIQKASTQTLTGRISMIGPVITSGQSLSGVARIQKTIGQNLTGALRVQKTTSTSLNGVVKIKRPLLDTVSDLFNAGSLNTTLWSSFGGSNVVQGSGTLSITTNLTAGYFGINTSATYDFTNSYAFTQLKNAGNQALSNFEVYPVLVQQDSNNNVNWLITGNQIGAYNRVAGTMTQVGSSSTYDSTLHRFFRIRELSGTTYWEYSTEGTIWTSFASVANPINYSSVQMVIQAGCWGSNASTTTAVFDNFNALPPIVTNSQTITGKIDIRKSTQQALTGALRVQVTAPAQTLTGKTRVQKTVTASTLTGKINIVNTTQKTLTGKVDIRNTAPVRTLTGKVSVVQTSTKTLTGKVNIYRKAVISPKIRLNEHKTNLYIRITGQ